MEAPRLSRTQSTLSFEQVDKLKYAYQMPVEVHGRGNFPTLEVRDSVLPTYYYNYYFFLEEAVEDR